MIYDETPELVHVYVLAFSPVLPGWLGGKRLPVPFNRYSLVLCCPVWLRPDFRTHPNHVIGQFVE